MARAHGSGHGPRDVLILLSDITLRMTEKPANAKQIVSILNKAISMEDRRKYLQEVNRNKKSVDQGLGCWPYSTYSRRVQLLSIRHQR